MASSSSSSDDAAQAAITRYISALSSTTDVDYTHTLLTTDLSLLSARAQPRPACSFGFTVTTALCNKLSNLHGGAAATIFDLVTSLALVPVAKVGWWRYLGVSRSLNVTYLRPAPCGTEMLVEATVLAIGRRLCTCLAFFSRLTPGLTTFRHHTGRHDQKGYRSAGVTV